MSPIEKIAHFLSQHHVMTLATSLDAEVSACSLFYVYDQLKYSFVVASADETTHIRHTMQNPRVAGNIYLETKNVGKIQGVQFRGVFSLLEDEELSRLYFKAFPYALALAPKLWKIEVEHFKMTDNTLGFGKKIDWSRGV